MDRDDLVERVAEALWREDFRRGAGRERITPWAEAGDHPHMQWRSLARAALAIIEPAVREDIARELDCACDCRDAVLAATTKTDRWRACGRDPCSALDARDIRAGAKP